MQGELVSNEMLQSGTGRVFFEREVSTQLGCRWFRKHMSSGWFDHTEPSLSTSLQGKQGVQGAYALVRGGSSTSNLIESSRIT